MAIAFGISIIAAYLTLPATRSATTPLPAFARVIVLLLASARICAAIGRGEEPEGDGRL